VSAALYEAQVVHTRSRPRHRLRASIYLWLVDLDRLPRVPWLLRPLSRIEARDHLGDPAAPIRRNVDAFLAGRGIDLDGGQVLLLTSARVLGHVFNPLSVFYCHARDGSLRCVVAEVHNTYGERHAYVLEPDGDGRCETDKAFYVSPFLSVDGSYRMRFTQPGERISVAIELVQGGERVFCGSVAGRRVPLHAGSLLRLALRHPLVTRRVSLSIRLHGIALLLRRVPTVPRPRRTP
jgi:DUF1365 family protein